MTALRDMVKEGKLNAEFRIRDLVDSGSPLFTSERVYSFLVEATERRDDLEKLDGPASGLNRRYRITLTAIETMPRALLAILADKCKRQAVAQRLLELEPTGEYAGDFVELVLCEMADIRDMSVVHRDAAMAELVRTNVLKPAAKRGFYTTSSPFVVAPAPTDKAGAEGVSDMPAHKPSASSGAKDQLRMRRKVRLPNTDAPATERIRRLFMKLGFDTFRLKDLKGADYGFKNQNVFMSSCYRCAVVVKIMSQEGPRGVYKFIEGKVPSEWVEERASNIAAAEKNVAPPPSLPPPDPTSAPAKTNAPPTVDTKDLAERLTVMEATLNALIRERAREIFERSFASLPQEAREQQLQELIALIRKS